MRLLRSIFSSLAAAAATAACCTLPGCGGPSTPTADSAGSGGGRTSTSNGGSGASALSKTSGTMPREVPRLIAPANPSARSVKVPALTWHRVAPVGAVGQLDLKVDPAVFDGELSALQRAGYHAISDAQLFGALYHGAALPAKPVLLTFDDGYVDDIRTILPDLRRHGMVGTFFVITSRFTEPGFLTAAQVRRLDSAGMDIGDHTAHHVDLRRISAGELRIETLGSRRALQRTLGHFVYAFAYPFGANDATVRAAVARAGYTFAFTTASGVTESTAAPLQMPRIHVGRSQTPSGLVALLGG